MTVPAKEKPINMAWYDVCYNQSMSQKKSSLHTQAFFDAPTFTMTYLVWDKSSKDTVVIDPVLNFDPAASQTTTHSVDELTHYIQEHGLKLHWILETHAHADHLSGAQLLKSRFNVPIGIGVDITKVQKTFKNLFNLPDSFVTDGSQFDELFEDGQHIDGGSITVDVISTPGHTPACVSYKIDDMIFTGDALFMHDYGTGRTDFPEGNAEQLYHSIHTKLYSLPDDTRVFVGHDYQPNGRELRYQTTIGQSKKLNPQLNESTPQLDFVTFRQNRDATLQAPRLLFPSVQVNINAGLLPGPASNGQRYLSIPINLNHPTDEFGNPS